MKNKKLIIIIYIVLILAIVGLIKTNFNPSSNSIYKEIHHNIQLRNFNKFRLIKNDSFSYNGIIFRIQHSNNRINLIDIDRGKMLSLDEFLNPIDTLGVYGEGPDEIKSMKSGITRKDRYIVFDYNQQSIKEFKKNNSLISNYSLKKSNQFYNDVIFLDNDLILLSHTSGTSYMFSLFDYNQKKVTKSFDIKDLFMGIKDNFISKNLQGIDLIFEGYFSRNNFGEVIYTLNKAGYVIHFDKDGEVKKIIRTIDKVELPNFIKEDIGGGAIMHKVSPDIYINASRAMSKDYIFILSNLILEEYKFGKVIDIYSIKNGTYFSSIIIPNLNNDESPQNISFLNNKLIIGYENSTIFTYELEENQY